MNYKWKSIKFYNISQYNSIKVHDGPGTLDSVLEPIVSKGDIAVYPTTTFQCHFSNYKEKCILEYYISDI